MNFRQYFEASVETIRIPQAIEKSIDLIVPGYWKFKTKPHSWHDVYKATRMDAIGVVQNKGMFFVGMVILEDKPIAAYDSKKGHSSLKIKIDIFGREALSWKASGGFQRINSTEVATPYEAATWIKDEIEKYGNDDDYEDPSLEPIPDPQLVGIA